MFSKMVDDILSKSQSVRVSPKYFEEKTARQYPVPDHPGLYWCRTDENKGGYGSIAWVTGKSPFFEIQTKDLDNFHMAYGREVIEWGPEIMRPE